MNLFTRIDRGSISNKFPPDSFNIQIQTEEKAEVNEISIAIAALMHASDKADLHHVVLTVFRCRI